MFTISSDSERIAGSRTVADWKKLRSSLEGNNDPKVWSFVFNEFLLKRLETRYLSAIDVLRASGSAAGEGFSIATIQCALIEFMAAVTEGKWYRPSHSHLTPDGFSYNDSAKLFKRFLIKEFPFSSFFDEESAEEFYVSVRCGLLHEAQTKNGWRIHRKSRAGTPINREAKVLYRDSMQECLLVFVKKYGEELQKKKPLQNALVRKFDRLCGLQS